MDDLAAWLLHQRVLDHFGRFGAQLTGRHETVQHPHRSSNVD